MKYLAICALLLPLVYGAVIPRDNANANVDLVPDMSTAEDGKMFHVIFDMSVASDALYTPVEQQVGGPAPLTLAEQSVKPVADADLVPDMSVAADAEDKKADKPVERPNADLVPDMSVAADAIYSQAGKAELKAEQVPDMAVAADALDKAANKLAQVPDMSVASDAL